MNTCYAVVLWDYDAALVAAVYTNEEAAKADAKARQCEATVYEVELDAPEPPPIYWEVFRDHPLLGVDEIYVEFRSGKYTDDYIASALEDGIAIVSAVGRDEARRLGLSILEGREK